MKEKKHKKLMRKADIRVTYKDGTIYIIPKKFWDDYEYLDGYFVVKRRGAWIGIFNMDSIARIIIAPL